MTKPITITVILSLKDDAADAFCAGFPEMLNETRQYKGFRSIEVHRNEDVPSRVIIVESWDSKEDYFAYNAWRMADGGKEAFESLLAAPPVTEFWNIKVA